MSESADGLGEIRLQNLFYWFAHGAVKERSGGNERSCRGRFFNPGGLHSSGDAVSCRAGETGGAGVGPSRSGGGVLSRGTDISAGVKNAS